MDDQIPLIVPEVNGPDLKGFEKGIIANPNCSTIQMVVPLKVLDDAFGLVRVEASSYQSVSGTGQQGIAVLDKEAREYLESRRVTSDPLVYPKPIGFSVISGIGAIDENGHCEEEIKMVKETQKILGKPHLDVLVTTVRVPVFHCHSEAVSVQLKRSVSIKEAWEVLAKAAGLIGYQGQDPKFFHGPSDVHGRREVFLSRLRVPYGCERSNWLQFWVVADNLKKGAASNAVQILETLLA
jgi:aspartate-semialdehyde dehydrogenase